MLKDEIYNPKTIQNKIPLKPSESYYTGSIVLSKVHKSDNVMRVICVCNVYYK